MFFDPEKFGHIAYADGYGDLLLNEGAEVISWAEVLDRARSSSRYVFIKPVDDFKGFTGQAISLSAIDQLFKKISGRYGPSVKEALVVVGGAYEIDAEWRLFVVAGEVVTGSMYRPSGGGEVPADVWDFGRRAARVWSPAPVYTLDIAKIGGSLKIIECNCFNASRLYDADVSRLVQVVSEYQEAHYQPGPNAGSA